MWWIYRGKRKDNGEWVYGDLLHGKGKQKGRLFIWYETDKFPFVNEAEVIPESVERCTCLPDKNGTRIFEGDIVKTKYGRVCKVVWFSSSGHQCWNLIPLEDVHQFADMFDLWSSNNIEVIGNIHDNPELLEAVK